MLTPGATTSPRFHSHIDAVRRAPPPPRTKTLVRTAPPPAPPRQVSHAFLRDVLMRVAPTGSQVKLYPVSDLELGPQSRPGGGGAAGAAVYARAAAPFAPVYKRLANFHRIAGNPADEAFATVAMGDAGLDYAHLAACLSLASAYAHGEVLVEVEENVFEAETDVRTGAQSVTLDAGETPYAVDWAQLPAGAQARAMPSAERPRFELHHGFDVTKSSEDEAGPPIGLDAVMTASAELAGMAVGGWFIFAKRGGEWRFGATGSSGSDPAPSQHRLPVCSLGVPLQRVLERKLQRLRRAASHAGGSASLVGRPYPWDGRAGTRCDDAIARESARHVACASPIDCRELPVRHQIR